MITGLPPYREPVVQDMRCVCRRFYRVYVGCEDYQTRFAEKVAQDLGATFIDAKVEPFVTCTCGQVLDFAPEASLMVM
jgi:hypothetical protein